MITLRLRILLLLLLISAIEAQQQLSPSRRPTALPSSGAPTPSSNGRFTASLSLLIILVLSVITCCICCCFRQRLQLIYNQHRGDDEQAQARHQNVQYIQGYPNQGYPGQGQIQQVQIGGYYGPEGHMTVIIPPDRVAYDNPHQIMTPQPQIIVMSSAGAGGGTITSPPLHLQPPVPATAVAVASYGHSSGEVIFGMDGKPIR